MSMRLRRGMISETGPGWAVTSDGGIVLPGRWPDRESCWQQGFLGVYLMSGLDVVEVGSDDRPVTLNARD